MANVNFYVVKATQEATAAERFAGMVKDPNSFYIVGSDLYIGGTRLDNQADITAAINALGTAASADVATSPITESSTDTGLVSAAQVANFVVSEIAGLEGAMHFVGVIERQTGETDAQAIARVVTDPEDGDVVVMSDNALEYIYTGSAWREVGDETSFVKKTTTIAGVALTGNISKSDLLTALNVADGAEVNVVDTVKVNGSALTPDANKAVDILIAEGSTDGAISVNGSSVNVHGLGSAAYEATTAFEAAGAVATAIGALDADVDASGTAQHSGTFVVSGITEVDGVITGVDSIEVEAAGAAAAVQSAVMGNASTDTAASKTIEGLVKKTDATNTYVGTIPSTSQATDIVGYIQETTGGGISELDATVSQTAGADGLALQVVEVDGKLTSVSGSIAANTYDAYGAAADVADDLDDLAELVGEIPSGASATTVTGYVDEAVSNALTWVEV